MNIRRHINLAIFYFTMAALIGLLLRLTYVVDVPITYKHFLHGHSHIALLGWVYFALSSLIYHVYLRDSGKEKTYRYIFWFTQLTIVGMLITFPIQGYALFSIIFSTLFLIASYWFAGFAMKNVKPEMRNSASFKCIRAALWLLILSSIGPWALGAIMNTMAPSSIWYKTAIYFYLHFLYNGWFILALAGLFLYVLEAYDLQPSGKQFKTFFWLALSSIVLTFFLSVLWTRPFVIFYILAGLGIILQWLATWLFYDFFKAKWLELGPQLNPMTVKLIQITFGLFLVKISLQTISGIPGMIEVANTIFPFIIGYIHWVFLGVVSLGLFTLFQHHGLFQIKIPSLTLYLSGFFLSEALIFYKGLSIWLSKDIFGAYDWILFGTSALIPVALLWMLWRNVWDRRSG